MADYHNPAGRLHELLTRFAAQQGKSAVGAWASVLDVTEADVPMYLGEVASLLRDVRDAAKETGLDHFDPIPQHLTTLSQSIFPLDQPFRGQSANVAPDASAMQALKMLSAFLENTASEGKIPEDDELDELRESVRQLVEEVSYAELPPEIRRALLHRLVEMQGALEHLNIGGPDAVRRAAESLAISAVIYEGDAEHDGAVFSKIKLVARKTWLAFTVTTTLANAVLTWDRITDLHFLGPGQEQRQLPPPSSSSPGDIAGSNDEPR